MTKYKVTDEATGEVWIWNAQELLEEVNRGRSDDWTDYTIEDLENSLYDVLGWIEYTVDEVAPCNA